MNRQAQYAEKGVDLGVAIREQPPASVSTACSAICKERLYVGQIGRQGWQQLLGNLKCDREKTDPQAIPSLVKQTSTISTMGIWICCRWY